MKSVYMGVRALVSRLLPRHTRKQIVCDTCRGSGRCPRCIEAPGSCGLCYRVLRPGLHFGLGLAGLTTLASIGRRGRCYRCDGSGVVMVTLPLPTGTTPSSTLRNGN